MATHTATRARKAPSARIQLSLNDPTIRSILWQVIVVAIIGYAVWYLVANTQANLAARKIATGFGFLSREAGLPIGEMMIEYTPEDTYARAILVGLLNTLRVAVVGIVAATVLGTLIGIARLSKNWLLAKLASGYVETLRNLPLIVQLFFWYAIITETMPGVRQALNPLPGVFVSQRGIKFPVPVDDPAHVWMALAMVVGVACAVMLSRWARQRQALTGQQFPSFSAGVGLVVGLPALVWLGLGAPATMDWPALRGFNFVGGATLTPEFFALLAGLITYTAAFIAEIVRSGILAVSHGQSEAAMALGLKRGWILRLVVLPQAMRVIIPPMTSQYLNLAKNSSLAVAIGYPDIVSIANTTLNQTGQAIEGIAIIMAVYLTISLSISVLMNWYNARIALRER
jgi:general L-amino acid transport system permease protein